MNWYALLDFAALFSGTFATAIIGVLIFEVVLALNTQRRYGGNWIVRFSWGDLIGWARGKWRLCFKCGAVFSKSMSRNECFCHARFYIERRPAKEPRPDAK